MQLAAGQISAHPDGGHFENVGHTGDVLDEDFNQALSENRAGAVEARLAESVDPSAWQVCAVGKGES